MKKIETNWKKVFKRYSFITHLLIAISSVGMVAIMPFIDYIPIKVFATITGVLAVMGVVGSFVRQSTQDIDNI
jgi:roadblock/LC7 domain-containing protein